jgi:hypothetical protein
MPFDPMATMAGSFPQDLTFYGLPGGTGGPLSSGAIISEGPSSRPSGGSSGGGLALGSINSYGPSSNPLCNKFSSRHRNSPGSSSGLSGMPASLAGRSPGRSVSPLISRSFNSHGLSGGPYKSGNSGSNTSSGHYSSGTSSMSPRSHSASPAQPYSVSEAPSWRGPPGYT